MRQSSSLLVFCFLGSLASGCSDGSYNYPETLKNEFSVDHLVELMYSQGIDEFIGREMVGFSLRITNAGKDALTDCELRIDDIHRAPVSQLENYQGLWIGNKVHKKSTIDSGEVLNITFSHDTNNYLKLDAPKDRTEFVELVSLACNEGVIHWRLEVVA